MATFYVGPRPVLKGRNTNDQVHTWKNEQGTYSNWSIFDTSQVLDGAPDNHVEPGAGAYPSDYFMSYIFRGEHHIAPLKDPGLGPKNYSGVFEPLLFKGVTSGNVFPVGFGHAPDRVSDYSKYTNLVFDGLDVAEPLDDPGHAKRYTSPINSFGSFDPLINKGVTINPLEDPGHAIPTGYDGEYGNNKPLEWQGVTSARAL